MVNIEKRPSWWSMDYSVLEKVLVFLKVIGISIGTMLLTFVGTIYAFIGGLAVLIIGDYFLGVSAAKLRGEDITKEGRWVSLGKAKYYAIGLVMANVVDFLLLSEFVGTKFSIVYAVAVLAMWDELRSGIRNVGELTKSPGLIKLATIMPKIFTIDKLLSNFTDKKEK